MNYERWKDIAELIGLAAIVASLVFVGMELRQTERTARVELIARVGSSLMQWEGMIIENADLWARGCVGDELSVSDQVRFANLHRAYITYSFQAWLAEQDVNVYGLKGSPVVDSLAANIHRYPGFRAAGAARAAWTELGYRVDGSADRDRFVEGVRTRLAELAELEPEPLMDVRFCGL